MSRYAAYSYGGSAAERDQLRLDVSAANTRFDRLFDLIGTWRAEWSGK